MPSTAIVDKLESIFKLTRDERQAVENLPFHVRDAKSGETLIREGDRPAQCCLILSGLACRFKVAGGGRRQILSFHISGDLPDLQSLHLQVMDHDIGMLRAGKVAFIPHAAILAMNAQHFRIAMALWRNTLIEAAIFRQWISSLGSMSALGRVAHFLCERIVLTRVIEAGEWALDRTPTQEEIGDALGLSVVHVNRTMRALREAGLVAIKGRRLQVLDWEGLKRAGEFDPMYLHLGPVTGFA
jgi:CRP-like cAMP-binding protein